MVGREILEQLFDKKIITILRVFLDNPTKQYYLREIAKITKVSPATTMRILHKLKKSEIIDEIRLKKFKAYQLHEGETTQFLEDVVATKRSAVDEFIRQMKLVPGVDVVLLHGQELPEKANLLVIGKKIDVDLVYRSVMNVKERYNFTILHLILEPEQFEQMTHMGLYSGKKTVLYRRQNTMS
jgi:DNA-binding transcriptional regulator YhcF (GntR family)